MSVPQFNVLSMDTLTELVSFDALLSPKDGSDCFSLRVFALNTQLALEKLIVNLPLDWQGEIRLLGDPAVMRYLVFPRFVCESLEQF
jgi:hypothetical protein